MQATVTAAACAVFASLPWFQQDVRAVRVAGEGPPAWADFDGDGLKDVVALTPRGGLRLMKNLGDGRFEDAGAAAGIELTGASLVQWLDYDGDGAVDLAVGTLAGAPRLYRNQDGVFSDTAAEAGLTHSGRDLALAQLDFDGDGLADLHFRTDAADVFYRNLGHGAYEAVALDLAEATVPVGVAVTSAPPTEREEDALTPRVAADAARRVVVPGQPARDTSREEGGGGGPGRSLQLPPDVMLSGGMIPMMPLCTPGIQDQNSVDNCINASTDPTFGMLYPLGHDFYINDSGRVGIGTISPTRALHVVGDGLFTGEIEADGDIQADGQLRADFGTVAEPTIRFSESEPTGFSSPAPDELVASTEGQAYHRIAPGVQTFSIGGIEAMRIDSGRDVGIGTTNPTGRLQVSSNGVGVSGATVRSLNFAFGSGIAYYGSTQGSDATMVLTQNGSGSIFRGFNGGAGPVIEVLNSGRVVTTALQITGGGDLVEGFEATDECEPGTVVSIDPENPGQLRASTGAYDSKVAGVVSGANGVNHGIRMGQDDVLDGDTLVAMSGRVYVRCTSENGTIEPGDLLTTASLAGHAMKATDSERSFGAVIGKAMTALDSETGLVLVLVNLQ